MVLHRHFMKVIWNYKWLTDMQRFKLNEVVIKKLWMYEEKIKEIIDK